MEISVGAILEGSIKSITKFGAFVSLPGGRSGLVHISEIAHSYVADVRDFLTEGQTVKVKVVGIDDVGRINLSIKKAAPPPPRSQNFQRDRQGRSDFRGGNNNSRGDNRGSHYNNSNGSSHYNNSNGGSHYNNRNSNHSAPRSSNHSGGYNRDNRSAGTQATGPADFEARLKQFMQVSDSKLSDLRMTEKRSSRRSGHR